MVNNNLLNKKVKAFILDGKRIEVKQWNEVLIKVVEILYEKHQDEFLILAQQNKIRGQNNIYLSTEKSNIIGTSEEIKPGLFLEIKFNAPFMIDTCVKFLSEFNYQDFKIETSDNLLFSVIPEKNEPQKIEPEINYFILRTGGGNWKDVPNKKYNFSSNTAGQKQVRSSENNGKFVYLEQGKFYAIGEIGSVTVDEESEKEIFYHFDVFNYQEISPVESKALKLKINLQINQGGITKISKEQFDNIINPPSSSNLITTVNKKPKQFIKQIILYGPPGTGKTYNSIIKAHEIIFGISDSSITFSKLQAKLLSTSKRDVDITQISSWLNAIMLAFHEIQSEKIQVNEIKNSKIIQEYSLITNNHTMRNTIWYTLQAESRLDSDTVKQKRKTGNEFFDKDSESNWYLTEKGKVYLKSLREDIQDSSSTSISQFNFITFHQSFSYEDFIEGIKPDLDEVEGSKIVYTVKDGIFKEICIKASLDTENNYVLIIDEINRGNISKIFGELITLLEDNKRTGEKEAITVRLPYSKKDFSVPNNVYIIGTMNSTDKSIALVDVALRRRFHFERLNVNYDLILNEEAKKFLMGLNGIICALKNPDFEIGHSYFMNIPKIDEGNKELKKVFSTKILSLIEEYFFNDWEALATILSPDSIQIEKRKKLVWDEDSGEFKKESEEVDKISGRCIDYNKDIFENTRKNLENQQKAQDITK
jgi:5-methylcytosine-specific restriction protein B